MRSKFFKYSGVAAAVVLIAFGIGSLVVGMNGRDTVRDNLAAEQITGTPDMTPALTAKAVKEAGLKNVDIPSKSVAGQEVNTGERARVFAEYMRIHALEATGGQVYSQMGRFLDENGKPTSDEAAAAKDPKTGRPVENAARNLWVTETALATALNTSYFAENVALFSIVMGIALILTGTGFLVLALGLERAPVRETEEAAATKPATPVPTAV